jgi:hypothetical protein
LQPVNKGRSGPAAARFGQVLAVGSQNIGDGMSKRSRHGGQRGILLMSGRNRNVLRGRLSATADIAHQTGDIPAIINCFQRCGHNLTSICHKRFLAFFMAACEVAWTSPDDLWSRNIQVVVPAIL